QIWRKKSQQCALIIGEKGATLPDAVACKCNFLYLGNVQLTSRLGLLLTFDALLPTHSLTFDSYSGISSQ
ncbi:unnamed protein product, partial [Tenebrio molitor]